MDISANELTQWAKLNLGYIGVRLNRVNNIPYGRRKGTIEKGWADLQGYNQEGKYVMVEVKKLGDKLHFELNEDPNPLGVDMPEILDAIIEQDEQLKDIFDSLTLGKKRNIIHQIIKIKDIDKQIQKSIKLINESTQPRPKKSL